MLTAQTHGLRGKARAQACRSACCRKAATSPQGA